MPDYGIVPIWRATLVMLPPAAVRQSPPIRSCPARRANRPQRSCSSPDSADPSIGARYRQAPADAPDRPACRCSKRSSDKCDVGPRRRRRAPQEHSSRPARTEEPDPRSENIAPRPTPLARRRTPAGRRLPPCHWNNRPEAPSAPEAGLGLTCCFPHHMPATGSRPLVSREYRPLLVDESQIGTLVILGLHT